VETPPNESSDQEPASGDELVDQAGIDALLQAAGGAGTPEQDTRVPIAEDAIDPPGSDGGADPPGPYLDDVTGDDRSVSSLAANAQPSSAPGETRPLDLLDLESSAPAGVDPKRVTMLNDVDLRVKIQLGQTRMLVEDVLKLGEGSVVELDKLAGDPVDVFVNDRLIARGEVLVLNDNFCVRVSEVLSCDPHRVSA